MAASSPSALDVETAGPLSARSVVLSLVLGAHPEPMTPAGLSRTATHFGVAPSTLRAAVARAAAAGDLVRDDAGYRLGARLLSREERQREAVEAVSALWDGQWELAVVVKSGRSGRERAALREELQRHRLAERREGVWMRPANLRRRATYGDDPVVMAGRCTLDEDPRTLAAELWDLEAWATTGERLLELMATVDEPARRLSVAAHLVRHLATDPLLPPDLLPPTWPGPTLRATYADYQAELRRLDV